MSIKSIRESLWRLKIYILGHYFPKKLVEYRYKDVYGRSLNWNNPQTLDEKVNWSKFYSDTSAWVRLADKYAVREFVKDRGLAESLVQLYGKWNRAEDIDWASLPDKFIMKVNNGSGDVIKCDDKQRLDIPQCVKRLKKQMACSLGYDMGEPHYTRIKPCIIAEQLLDYTHQAFPSTSMIDYKIFSFDGEPAFVQVCLNRRGHVIEIAIYDTDWNFHPEYSVVTKDCLIYNRPLPKPKALPEMLRMASVLSKGFPFVRVDLYEVNDKPYFGEMTFTPAAGFISNFSADFQMLLGSKFRLKR